MFRAANVDVYLVPVIQCVLVRESVGVVGIDVAQKIPGSTCMCRHGVAVAPEAGGKIDPLREIRERPLARAGGLEVVGWW